MAGEDLATGNRHLEEDLVELDVQPFTPMWCDAHHIGHWLDGGPTTLHNLELLCRRHHRMTHYGGALDRKACAP